MMDGWMQRMASHVISADYTVTASNKCTTTHDRHLPTKRLTSSSNVNLSWPPYRAADAVLPALLLLSAMMMTSLYGDV